MIRLPDNITPSPATIDQLKKYQDEIDRLPTFAEKTDKARSLFANTNRTNNKTFAEVKAKLTAMCAGARRCAYCEDSVADEIEHIHPKNLYPEMCFCWENYVYACGSCNVPKNDKFAVFRADNGVFQLVNPHQGQKAVAPPAGSDVLINPRIEDPLIFCMLDLTTTFQFVVLADEGTPEHKRASYTYNEVLRLNDREYLRVARKNAFANYKARLYEYTDKKNKGAAQDDLNKMVEGIKSEAHPTVWKEMQRHHINCWLQQIDRELDNLFWQSPEALGW